MMKAQRDVLIDAFKKLRDGADHGAGLVRTGATPETLARYIAELVTCVQNIEDAFGRSIAAGALLERIGERAKVLSSSKP